MNDIPDDVTLGEVYRAVAAAREELSADINEVKQSLARVVYVDVFSAEKATLLATVERHGEKADAARALALWALGLMIAALLSAILAIVLALVAR